MVLGSLEAQPLLPPSREAQPTALPDCQTQPAQAGRPASDPDLSQGRARSSNQPGSLESDPNQPQSTVSSTSPTIPIAGYSGGLAQLEGLSSNLTQQWSTVSRLPDYKACNLTTLRYNLCPCWIAERSPVVLGSPTVAMLKRGV